MARRKKWNRPGRIIHQAVWSGASGLAEIRAILKEYGHELDGATILAEVERAERKMKKAQHRAAPAAPMPAPNPGQMLQYVTETPMEGLRFDDFVNLRSGHDKFSTYSYRDLMFLVPEFDQADEALGNETQVASCLRWVLRGLPIEKAIRKVKTDTEVAKKARKAQRRR